MRLDPLFAWCRLEDLPQLSTLSQLLSVLPDQELLHGLREARGKGRNDYPVEHLWSVVVLTVALRHQRFESCIAELHRNPALCRLIGITAVKQIPKGWNLSRFLDVRGQEPHLSRIRAVFDFLVTRLGVAVPDLGRHTASDATGLNARPRKDAEAVAEEIEQGLPQPSGGRKEYKDDQDKVVKVVEWFGYKLHLMVDVKHEVPLAFCVSDTKVGDNERVAPLVEQARANLPQGLIETMAYDKAADDEKIHEHLHQAGIEPLIQNRTLWKEELERPLPGPAGRYPLNVVHDESGTLYCSDQSGRVPVRHRMAYVGYEKDRETLKYRCPARHEDWVCPSDERCNEGESYGMIVRVDHTMDLRRFPPIPRDCEVREDVQGAHGGGASQGASEDILGSGRRERDGSAAVPCVCGSGDGSVRSVRNAAGEDGAKRVWGTHG